MNERDQHGISVRHDVDIWRSASSMASHVRKIQIRSQAKDMRLERKRLLLGVWRGAGMRRAWRLCLRRVLGSKFDLLETDTLFACCERSETFRRSRVVICERSYDCVCAVPKWCGTHLFVLKIRALSLARTDAVLWRSNLKVVYTVLGYQVPTFYMIQEFSSNKSITRPTYNQSILRCTCD